MESDERIQRQVGELDAADNVDSTQDSTDVQVGAGGLLAGNLAAANMGPGSIGMLGGGVVGAMAADQAIRSDEGEEEPVLNLDALEQFGSKHRETGDSGVSPRQAEIEADEQNG